MPSKIRSWIMRRMISPSCWGVQHVTDWSVVDLGGLVVVVVVVVVVGVVVGVFVDGSGGSVVPSVGSSPDKT